jgi:hypothetical protein
VTPESDLSMTSSDGGTTQPDMTEPSGCAAGDGVRLPSGIYKCPGAFGGTAPKASALCASGFAPCQTINAAAQAACNAEPFFFASAIIGSRRDGAAPGTGKCDQSELYGVVYGCGNSSLVASMSCGGFDHLIDCNQQVATWTCASTLDATVNKLKGNGVLCCRQ